VDNMAYLRTDKEIVEMDYPLATVWTAIHRAITRLEWTEDETDDEKYHVKAKTKGAIMSYGSTVSIDAKAVSEETTRVNISAETPVTTLTGIVDFGRTKERIENFLAALAEQLNVEKKFEKK